VSAILLPLVKPNALEKYPPTNYTVSAFVDNFNIMNNRTFGQRVLQFDRWWVKGGPILLYLGNEGPIEDFYNNTGAIFEHAHVFGALVTFVEHRFYGKSSPCIHQQCTSEDLSTLTVEQAMADYAWFIHNLTKSLNCARAECPIVTFGGSYGGMLVAWFRQKYPQLTVGGIAASAPIDFYSGTGIQSRFWNATLYTFDMYGSHDCSKTVSEAMLALKNIGQSDAGRKRIEDKFRSCHPLSDEPTATEKADFFVRGVLASLAMLDYTVPSNFVTQLPANPVSAACHLFQGESDHLSGLKAVIDLFLNATGNFQCYDILAEMVGRPTSGKLAGPKVQPDMGPWQYQACNELNLQTLTSDGYGFFPASDEQLSAVSDTCCYRYGMRPRGQWLPLSLGRSDLRIGGLLFTDGDKDPWHVGTVDVHKLRPDVDIVHHLIHDAAHHEDLRFDTQPPRPQVVRAKNLARESMRRWFSQSDKLRVVI